RRVLVIQSEAGKAKQSGFELKVVAAEAIVRFHNLHHGIDRGAVDFIKQMALEHRLRVVTQMVHGQMVLDQSAVNKCENLTVLRENFVDSAHSSAPQYAVGLVQEGKNLAQIEVFFFAV